MLNIKNFKYLIQKIIIGLAINQTCYSNEWVHVAKIDADTTKYKLVVFDELIDQVDVSIHLKLGKSTVSVQHTNHIVKSNDFLVINPGKNNRSYDVYLRTTSELIPIAYKSFTERTIESDSELVLYQFLYKNSQFQFSNKSKRALLEQFNDFFQIHPKFKTSLNEISNRYLWLLHYLQEYQTLSNALNNISDDINNDSSLRRNFLWLKAITYLDSEKYNLAELHFKEIIALLSDEKKLNKQWQLNKKEILATYGFTLTLIDYINQKDVKNSIDIIVEQLSGDETKNTKLLYLLAAAYSIQGDYIQSLEYCYKALSILDKSKSSNEKHYIYNQIAVNYYFLNDYNKAQLNYRKVLEHIDDELNPDSKAGIYYNLANTYRILGDYSRAYRYFEQAFDLYVLLNLEYNQYRALNVLGSINRVNKNYKLAIEQHKQSIKFFNYDSKRLLLYSIQELSKDYFEMDKMQLSLIEAQKAIIINASENEEISYQKLSQLPREKLKLLFDKSIDGFEIDNVNAFESVLLLGMIGIKSKNQVLAEKYFDKINNYSQLSQVPIEIQLRYYEFKLDYFILSNNFNSLESTIDSSFALINETRSKFDVSDLALYWSHQAQTILDKYIDALLIQNKQNEVFDHLEKYYAINLRDKRIKTINSVISTPDKQNQNAHENYIELERQSILSKDNELQNKADEAKERYLRLKFSSDVKNEVIPLNYLSINQLQEKLAPDELFLRYYINDNNAFVFVIEKEKYNVITLPNKQKLDQSVKQIIDDIKSKRFTNLSETKALLAELLPIEKIYSGQFKKLIIIPDGVFNLLPFGALNISQNDNEYNPLATAINVERTYSASDYFSQTDIPKNSETISVLANPTFIGKANKDIQSQYNPNNKLWEFKALPFSEREAQHISDVFNDKQVNLLTGKNATNDNFLSEATRNSNIIHIASHGFFNASNLEEVGIATSVVELDEHGNEIPSAGILAMREVLYKPFKSNLVVISGCETTLGKEISGEGFNSLSRGLLSQGVGSVIGTIWSISDRATPIFMKEFYTNLEAMNGNVSEALNQSKINFATKPEYRRYRHPYYWAGFVLTSSNRGISENIF